jgi:hypothetical protein
MGFNLLLLLIVYRVDTCSIYSLLPPPPRFVLLCVCCVGDWLVTILNANSHTFEVAPVFTLMESELLKKYGQLIGGDFAVNSDGLFVPGGSLSNLYALQLARFR